MRNFANAFVLIAVLLLRRSCAFATPNCQRKPLVTTNLATNSPKATYPQRPKKASPQHQLCTLNGGNNEKTSSDDNGNKQKRLLKDLRSFASKNFFLLGMFAAVGLARALPSVSATSGAIEQCMEF